MLAPTQPRLPLEIILRAVELALEDSPTDTEQYSCWSARGFQTSCDGCHLCGHERIERVVPFLSMNNEIRQETIKLTRRTFFVTDDVFKEFADDLGDESIRHRVQSLIFGSVPDFERPFKNPNERWALTPFWIYGWRDELLKRIATCSNLTDVQIPAGAICLSSFYFLNPLPDSLIAQLTSFSILGGSLPRAEHAGGDVMRLVSRMPNLVKLRVSGLRYFDERHVKNLPRPANLKELTLGVSHGMKARTLNWIIGRGAQVPALTLDCSLSPGTWEESYWELQLMTSCLAVISDRITDLTVYPADSRVLDIVFGWLRFLPERPLWTSLRHLTIRVGMTWGHDPHQQEAMGWIQKPDGTRKYLIQWPFFLYAHETALETLVFDIVMARRKRYIRLDVNRHVVQSEVARSELDPDWGCCPSVRINWAMVGYKTKEAAVQAVPSVRFCAELGQEEETMP